MMSQNPELIIKLDDYPDVACFYGKKMNQYTSLLKEGDVVEVELKQETKPRFYVVNKISNYLFTRGYMLYELKRAESK